MCAEHYWGCIAEFGDVSAGTKGNGTDLEVSMQGPSGSLIFWQVKMKSLKNHSAKPRSKVAGRAQECGRVSCRREGSVPSLRSQLL